MAMNFNLLLLLMFHRHHTHNPHVFFQCPFFFFLSPLIIFIEKNETMRARTLVCMWSHCARTHRMENASEYRYHISKWKKKNEEENRMKKSKDRELKKKARHIDEIISVHFERSSSVFFVVLFCHLFSHSFRPD